MSDPATTPPPPQAPPPMAALAYETPQVFVQRDAEHLRLLSIFHYVGGGLFMLMSLIPLIHIGMGIMFLVDPAAMGATSAEAHTMGLLFIVLGSAFLLIGQTVGALIIYSGLAIARRRHRTFSLIMAGIMCLQVPLGTLLGVFTFVVLLRDSVRALYAGPRAPARG